MCRMLGYVGPPLALGALLYDPPFSLEHQAFRPRHQGTLINADGWGVAWYDSAAGQAPARYRTAKSMWSDQAFRDMAGHIRSGHVVAAVRNASPGAPVEDTGASPFVADQYTFTHNGYVFGFRDGLGVQLRRGVSERREAGILGAADSEVVFAMVLDQLDKGETMAAALLNVLDDLSEHAGGKFNFMLSDGQTMVATRVDNSLFTNTLGSGFVVASEPFDNDPDWHEVPERSLVTANPDGVTIENIDPIGSVGASESGESGETIETSESGERGERNP